MTDNVVKFPTDITADEVLEGSKGHYESCIVVGWDQEGSLYMRGNLHHSESVILLLELAKFTYLQEAFGEDYSVH
tara:strand:- start:89 stop:313 length:225 start_codon:yes stop_codon:yes gene_type:complete